MITVSVNTSVVNPSLGTVVLVSGAQAKGKESVVVGKSLHYAKLCGVYAALLANKGDITVYVRSKAIVRAFKEKLLGWMVNGFTGVKYVSKWVKIGALTVGRKVVVRYGANKQAQALAASKAWELANNHNAKEEKIMADIQAAITRRFVMATDGSSIIESKNAKKPGAWAAVISGDGLEMEAYGAKPGQTNNTMELSGLIYGLTGFCKWLRDGAIDPKSCELTIVLDSEYVYHGYAGEKRVAKWESKGWKTSDGKDVMNQDLWEVLGKAIARVEEAGVTINWVRQNGHQTGESLNIRLNNRADELAGKARVRLLGQMCAPVAPEWSVNGSKFKPMFPKD